MPTRTADLVGQRSWQPIPLLLDLTSAGGRRVPGPASNTDHTRFGDLVPLRVMLTVLGSVHAAIIRPFPDVAPTLPLDSRPLRRRSRSHTGGRWPWPQCKMVCVSLTTHSRMLRFLCCL